MAFSSSFTVESGKRVGWIGVGVMGNSMAGHLLNAGYSVTVNTRTQAKAEALISKGAKWASTPREVAAASDVVFLMLGYPQEVRDVALNPTTGVLEGMKAGSVLVDMGTSPPSLARELAAQGNTKGVSVLDAPVSGGDIGARNATLSIMIGGEEKPVKEVQPLFEKMGKSIRHMGPAGAGQDTKMVRLTSFKVLI